jgi:hypothetical protein
MMMSPLPSIRNSMFARALGCALGDADSRRALLFEEVFGADSNSTARVLRRRFPFRFSAAIPSVNSANTSRFRAA